jgi:hypothetical protein
MNRDYDREIKVWRELWLRENPEKDPNLWDDNAARQFLMRGQGRAPQVSRLVENMGELGQRELPALMTVWGILPTEKQHPPDGKTWTEQELLAELEELP